jgi:PAS domain S-box-containing protein
LLTRARQYWDQAFHYLWQINPTELSDGVTARKQVNINQSLLTDVLKILNRGGDFEALISETLRLIASVTKFGAVGLRLRKDDDCPYFDHNGFSDEFLREENSLCSRGGDGRIVRDEAGLPVLECTCGLVLSGQTDPRMPCFTEGGSFWTNRARDLLELPPDKDPRTHPRNRCIHAGYQSVGLFPVRAGMAVIGLLQLNDCREGRFNPELVGFYETLAQNLGLAVQRAAVEEALRESEERFRLFMDNSPTVAWIKDEQGRRIYISKTYEDRFGVRLEDWRGKTDGELLPPGAAEKYRSTDLAVLSEDRTIRFIDETINPDGSRCCWLKSKFPFRDTAGHRFVGGIGLDITELRRAEDALRRLNEHLEETVTDRTAHLAAANKELEMKAEQLRKLAGELTITEQRERKRLSKILHDGLQQYLVAAKLHLSTLNKPLSGLPIQQTAAEVENLLSEAIAVSRSLAAELSPPILHDAGLVAGLKWLTRWMAQKHGLRIDLESRVAAPVLADDVKLLLFESVREILLNAATHAQADSIRIELTQANGRHLQISVGDNGKGFNPTRVNRAGFGLFSIRERISLIGGKLEIDSSPGNGTRVVLTTPLGTGVPTG